MNLISRNKLANSVYQYDKRKSKKLSPMASLLIEHLTEESNGFITAEAIKKKVKSILKLDLHRSTIAKHRKKYLGLFV